MLASYQISDANAVELHETGVFYLSLALDYPKSLFAWNMLDITKVVEIEGEFRLSGTIEAIGHAYNEYYDIVDMTINELATWLNRYCYRGNRSSRSLNRIFLIYLLADYCKQVQRNGTK